MTSVSKLSDTQVSPSCIWGMEDMLVYLLRHGIPSCFFLKNTKCYIDNKRSIKSA